MGLREDSLSSPCRNRRWPRRVEAALEIATCPAGAVPGHPVTVWRLSPVEQSTINRILRYRIPSAGARAGHSIDPELACKLRLAVMASTGRQADIGFTTSDRGRGTEPTRGCQIRFRLEFSTRLDYEAWLWLSGSPGRPGSVTTPTGIEAPELH